MTQDLPKRPAPVSFYEAFRFWLKLGFISFGGPAGQIAIMHTELVEQKRWISEKRFLPATTGSEPNATYIHDSAIKMKSDGSTNRVPATMPPQVRCISQPM